MSLIGSNLPPKDSDVTGQFNGVQNDDAYQADGDVPHGISPRMQARSLKHGYSPIGELGLDLTHDLVVHRKRPRRLCQRTDYIDPSPWGLSSTNPSGIRSSPDCVTLLDKRISADCARVSH
jgi:hypothetical protein